MTDDTLQPRLEHLLAALSQGLLGVLTLAPEGETVPVPRAWLEHWYTDACEALSLVRPTNEP